MHIGPNLLERIKATQMQDPKLQEICPKHQQGTLFQFRVLDDGTLRFADQVTQFLRYIIYPRGTKMYRVLKDHYQWSNIKREIAIFIAHCFTYQQVKVEYQRLAGYFQPLPLSYQKWDHITIDFVTGLLKTWSKHEFVWVIVDRLTKSAHFLPLRLGMDLEELAELYLREIV